MAEGAKAVTLEQMTDLVESHFRVVAFGISGSNPR